MNEEQMPEVRRSIPVPNPRRRKGQPKPIPASLRRAADEYKAAYKACYGIPISLKWDGKYVRIMGQTQGVTPSRLKEMTTQLRRRIG